MPSSIQERFGAKVRKKRKELGWSTYDFARISGLGRTYVNGVELGQHNVSLANVERFAKALGVPVAELLLEEDERIVEKTA